MHWIGARPDPSAKPENHAPAKIIRTTLGELIVAVANEVMLIMRDPSGLTPWCLLSCLIS
jgi:hypothetical protein